MSLRPVSCAFQYAAPSAYQSWDTTSKGSSAFYPCDIPPGRGGTCAFGVEATKLNGNIHFHFGGGDLTEAITTAIKKFKKNGKIGASGTVDCAGNTSKSQPVLWGIYHHS
ncbi:hypothetical protein NXS19_004384 [Fusarium pseudograminearum]|nr:hypothetical protein NXS19_004384 [Fusarium pseudograminearum]